MGKLPKLLYVCLFSIIFVPCSVMALQYENSVDYDRNISISPQQSKYLDTIEKRIYNNTFIYDSNIVRIERLEKDLFNSIQKGTPTQRINALRLESTRCAIRGTPMTPMMNSTFNSKYINTTEYSGYAYHDDVGIIDGLIRVWWPNFYAKLTEYRKYKEANFY